MSVDFELLSSEVVTGPSNDKAKGACLECGKTLTINANGDIRAHKCVNDVASSPKATVSNKRSKKMPPSVKKLGVNLVASGVELGATTLVVKATELPSSQVEHVTELPDPNVMIGPFLEFLWPQMPKGAQRVLTSLADESDLILAAIAWWGYGSRLKRFTQDNAVTTTKGNDNGQVSGPNDEVGGSVAFLPFTPDAVSGEAF